jgi:hypothetical protein
MLPLPRATARAAPRGTACAAVPRAPARLFFGGAHQDRPPEGPFGRSLTISAGHGPVAASARDTEPSTSALRPPWPRVPTAIICADSLGQIPQRTSRLPFARGVPPPRCPPPRPLRAEGSAGVSEFQPGAGRRSRARPVALPPRPARRERARAADPARRRVVQQGVWRWRLDANRRHRTRGSVVGRLSRRVDVFRPPPRAAL